MTCSFESYIKNAIRSIEERQLEEARIQVKEAMILNPEAPEPHNLLGIIAECGGDKASAGRHYRASLALDESYQPAYKNLDRVTSNYGKKCYQPLDLGGIQLCLLSL